MIRSTNRNQRLEPTPGVEAETSRRAFVWSTVLACALTVIATTETQAQEDAGTMCSNGVIGRIDVDNQQIYPMDATDPQLLRWAFGTANLLHIETTQSFIRRELLFQEGDCFDPFLLSESQRLLLEYPFLGDVTIESSDSIAGQKTVQVTTRDEWSTQIDVRLQYDVGLNIERFQATEENFLGHGITAQVTHAERRETRDRNARLFTPRLFGRTDADVSFGTTRGGSFFFQRVNHGFVGETNRFSGSELYNRGTSFYSYATGGAEEFSHLLVPIRHEKAEVAVATRLGDPGRSWILGVSLDRSVYEQDGLPEFVQNEDFGGSTPSQAELPAGVSRQVQTRGATRLAIHIGTRRFRYEEYIGLDAVSGREIVGLGFFGGLTLGKSVGAFLPEGVPDANDTYGRLYSSLTVALGQSLVHMSLSAEAARADGRWRDVLSQAAFAAYGRASWLPNQTLFFKVSTGGGWRTTMPFQLSLGGRDGVRSLRDDILPGGRRVLLVAEDRIRFDWPGTRALELGATIFADAGRVWASDTPFGSDSDWVGSVGFGLRMAVPAGSATIWRPEIVFPVGHDGSPIFRMTFEVNRIRYGFGTPGWLESRRFSRGAEDF
jgi:hypothetical protein